MRKILLITNDDNYRELMRLSLEEKFGCEVVCTSSEGETTYLVEKMDNTPLIIEVTKTSFIVDGKSYPKDQFHQMCRWISHLLTS